MGRRTVIAALAVLVSVGLVLGGLFWHARTLASPSGQERYIDGLRLMEGYGEGDTAVLRDTRTPFALLDLPSGSVWNAGVVQPGWLYAGRGPVGALVFDGGDAVIAYGTGGSELWRFEQPEGGVLLQVVALYPDGTAVLDWCEQDGAVSDGGPQGCRYRAIEPDGTTRWEAGSHASARAASFRVGTVYGLNGVMALPAAVVDRPQPRDTQDQNWRLFDPADGTTRDLGQADLALAGLEHIAVAGRDDPGGCRARLFDLHGVSTIEHTWVCDDLGDITLTTDHLIVGPYGGPPQLLSTRTADLRTEPSDIDAAAEHVFASPAGVFQQVGGDWSLIRLGDDGVERRQLPPGALPLAGGAETVVTSTRVDSANPLVPSDLYELTVISTVTGRECARTTYRGDVLQVSVLPGCRAAFTASPGGVADEAMVLLGW